MSIPQRNNRDFMYKMVLAFVMDDEGLHYRELIERMTPFIHDDQALTIVQRRRRKDISETDWRAIDIGKRHVARTYIDRAHRNGRIQYSGQGATRQVWLLSPPQVPNTEPTDDWTEERANIHSDSAVLHALADYQRRASGTQGAGDSLRGD